MALTDAQQLAVNTLESPLFIQAGAGTGKTHTLTYRLTHAFSPNSSSSGNALIEETDQFITITYTTKAAGELLSRIRAALRNAGLDEVALEVDSAWVSTIHSMCRRLLVEHALNTGVDSSAELIDEDKQNYFLTQAFNRFLEAHDADEELAELLGFYKEQTVLNLINALGKKIIEVQEGFSKISLGPAVDTPAEDTSSILRPLQEELVEAREFAMDRIKGGDKNSGPENLANFCEGLLEDIKQLLSEHHPLDALSLFSFVETIKPPAVHGNALTEAKEALWNAIFLVRAKAALVIQQKDLAQLLKYAEEIVEDYTAFKRSNSLMDTDELLSRAFSLLDKHPAVASEYQDQFKLVMIDEFQDTNRLQVGIIENLVAENMDTLATVGDRQQGIYRFRGADVSVFNEQQQKLKALGGKDVNLDTNFRSHDEILRFVDTLFGQEDVFGEALMSLKHGRYEDVPFVAKDVPRVRLLMSAGAIDGSSSADDLRENRAQQLAQHFADLRDNYGCNSGDMVILLGRLSYVKLYMDALGEQGFESQVVGGSVFYQAVEVRILINYLKALANPLDSPALLFLLTSPFYNLSDSELLLVADKTEPYQGLMQASEPSVVSAASHFRAALLLSEQKKASEVLRKDLSESGWLRSLSESGAQGMMTLANIEKFIKLLEDYEEAKGAGLTSAAAYFSDLLAEQDKGNSLKESPGTLQELGSDAVRIMTIHGSKGLEFPIVAVSEFEDRKWSEGAYYLAQDNNAIYPSIKVRSSFSQKIVWNTYCKERLLSCDNNTQSLETASSALEFYSYVRNKDKAESREESQRLLYVACTRAREILIVSMNGGKIATDKPSEFEGLMGSIETGVFGGTGFPHDEESFDEVFTFGNETTSYEGQYCFDIMKPKTSGETVESEGKSDEAFYSSEDELLPSSVPLVGGGLISVPVVDLASLPQVQISARSRHTSLLQSYSSIAAKQKAEAAQSAAEQKEPLDSDDPAAALTISEQATPIDGEHDAPVKDVSVMVSADAESEVEFVPHGAADMDATEFGLAFHLAAEKMLKGKGSAELCCSCAAAARNLDEGKRARLNRAFERWASSPRSAELNSFPLVFAEYPFFVSLPDTVPLQGIIDALGIDRANKKALICDYKTGHSGEGEPDVLRERYHLQATCYAYAVFKSFGSEAIEAVELAFVRPESGQDDSLEETVYRYTSADIDSLLDEILNSSRTTEKNSQ